MGGFFKVDRVIFDHEIWGDVVGFRLFFLILGQAVFHEDGIEQAGIHIKRGQWLRSYRNLRKDLEYREGRGYKQYGLATIKRSIQRLIEKGMITVSETEHGTLFTVVNYEKYQGFRGREESKEEHLTERKRNDSGTKAERQRNNNNNDNKDKNDKEINTPRRKRREYEEDSPYMKMASYFLKKIREWKPDFVFRGSMQTWADHFRKIHELDKRSKESIKEVIDWATSDPFWQVNILSPTKLRKQFDSLQGRMEQNDKVIPMKRRGNEPARGNVIPDNTDDVLAKYEAAMKASQKRAKRG